SGTARYPRVAGSAGKYWTATPRGAGAAPRTAAGSESPGATSTSSAARRSTSSPVLFPPHPTATTTMSTPALHLFRMRSSPGFEVVALLEIGRDRLARDERHAHRRKGRRTRQAGPAALPVRERLMAPRPPWPALPA